MRLLSAIICLSVIALLAAPLHAGMDEIKKLNQGTPLNEQYSRFYQTRELEYEQELYGQQVVVTYVFDKDLKLSAVGVADYAFTNVGDHVFWEVRDNLQDAVATTLEPPVQFAGISVQSGNQTFYEWAWLNADTYTDIYVKVKPGKDLNDYRFNFLFYDNSDSAFDAQFKELQARAASQTQGDTQ